jgi:uncharacterized protein
MINEIELHREKLRAICRRFHVRRLDLFGSAARGDFDRERSDVDFIVEFERDTPFHPFDAYFGLKEGLEGLLGRTVDLVVAGTIRNPYRNASIEQDRETVYAA